MGFGVDLVLIPLAAVLAPLLARSLGRWAPIPVVVFELLLGIILGPSVLGWARATAFADGLSQLGLAMLFFVAGSEIEFQALRGRTGRRAGLGWLISLAVGVAIGWIIAPGEPAIIIGIALASTTLGTLLPILRDAGELKTPFGRSVGAIGTVGEFGPLVAISIFLGNRAPGLATLVLGFFVLIAAAAIWYAVRAPRGRLHRFVTSTLHTSGQFAVRLVLLIVAALVLLSLGLDIDMLLGAFTAGIVWRLIIRDADEQLREQVESKIEAVAFGFLVPVFFVYTGVTFDLASLLRNPVLLALVPLATIALLIVRGLPSMLAAPVGSGPRDRMSIALLGATALPIIVAVTAIGVDKHIIPSSAAAVLVGAGMLSVLVYPLIGMSLRHERVDPIAEVADEKL
jgi:Kef-type K+ transport system membrane component KefB